jgi:hypothetical protein
MEYHVKDDNVECIECPAVSHLIDAELLNKRQDFLHIIVKQVSTIRITIL